MTMPSRTPARRIPPKATQAAAASAGTPPPVLLPYQAAWVADASEVKVAEKSRRIGISWTEAADDALHAASTSGSDTYYIGYNKDMAEEFIGDCAFWARHYDLAAGEIEEQVFLDADKEILSYRIRFASGHKIVALSSRPANLRGKQGRVVIDEAAFHDDLPGLLKAAMAFLMWGGQVRIISTHFGDTNPFNELVQDIRAGRKPYSLHRTTFDDALEQGLYKRICLVLGKEWSPPAEKIYRQSMIDFYGDDADEELFCIPSQGSGVYLTRALIETCLSPDIPVLRYEQDSSFAEVADHIREAEVRDWCDEHLRPLLAELPPDRDHFFGEDFGRTGDLSVFLPATETQEMVLRCPFLLELRNIPFRQQEQVLFYVVDRLPRFRHGSMDARGNGQYLAERAMQRYGAHRISQVMLSETWYRENMPAYKAAFEDRTILLPKDADVVADNRVFRVVKGVARLPEVKTKGRDGGQRHGDAGIAGVMLVHASRQEGGPAVYGAADPERAARFHDFTRAKRAGAGHHDTGEPMSAAIFRRRSHGRLIRDAVRYIQ